jgi:hypothetical protein
MGQYRFQGKGCSTKVSADIGYESVSIGSDSNATSFQDVVISPANQLLKNQDYYLYIEVPRDMNYDLTFTIKLVKAEGEGTSSEYQFVKSFTATRGGEVSNAYAVALYEKSTGEIAAMQPLTYEAGVKNTKDYLYREEISSNNYNYYLGNGNTTYTQTTNYNCMSMIATWKQETAADPCYIQVIFRPVQDGFGKILLSLSRDATDYNTQSVADDGTIEFGRKVDISKMKYELYTINNLIDGINKDGSLSRIGIWGAPGLLCAINGEEIRVGSNGVYELDAIPITSLGVMAKDNDYSNNFTIDYEYIVSGE